MLNFKFNRVVKQKLSLRTNNTYKSIKKVWFFNYYFLAIFKLDNFTFKFLY